MIRHSFFAAALLLASPTLALAQSGKKTSPPLASDPSASVPAPLYQSAFQGLGKGVEMQSLNWTKANAEVGQFQRGHIDVLKWEGMQVKDAPLAPSGSTVPARK